jgi:hypothetical protein
MSESFSKDITIGQKYDPAMKITDQSEADAYFEKCVTHNMSFGRARDTAEAIERENIGYYAGYYDDATQRRVERLFRCKIHDLPRYGHKGFLDRIKDSATALFRKPRPS